jgi:hypothetical protein
MWVIPPEHSGEFVAHMEEILDVYQMPYDPQTPMGCIAYSTPKLALGQFM